MGNSSPYPQTLSYRLGAVLFLTAAAARLLVFFIHGRSLAFLKYPRAAELLIQGKLDEIQIADFSPLYLALHFLSQLAGLANLDLLRILQIGLGALSCVLIAALGARLADRTTGLVAGLMAAIQHDMIIYDQVLEPETALVFCVVTAFFFALSPRFENRPWRWLGSGVFMGLAVATRPICWLAVPVVLVARTPLWTGGNRRAFVLWSTLFLGIVAAGQLTSSLGRGSLGPNATMSPWQVFYTGNNPQATGLWRPDFLVKDLERQSGGAVPDRAHTDFRRIAIAHGASSAEPDRYWAGLSFNFIADHPSRYLRLLGHKALALGQHHNPHDINTVYRLEDRLRGWPLISAWVVVALGLTGLVLSFRRLYLPFLMALSGAIPCVLFFVSARYRLALMPWLCISAASALSSLGRALNSRIQRRDTREDKVLVIRTLLVSALFTILFWLPLPPGAIAAEDNTLLRRAALCFRQADRLRQDRRLVRASAELQKAAFTAPHHLDLFPIPEVPFPLTRWAEMRIPDARARAEKTDAPLDWLAAGLWLDLAGYKQDAAVACEKVGKAALWPGDGPAVYRALIRKGLAHLSSGQVEPGRRAFDLASALQPGGPEALIGLAMCHAGDRAQGFLDRAARGTPLLEVLYLHGRMLLDTGRSEEAKGPLSKLVRGLPGYARGRMLYAVALYETGRFAEAADQAMRAQRQFPELFDPQYNPLKILTRAARQNPQNRSAWRVLARTARHYGDLDLALYAWRHLAERHGLEPGESIQVGTLLLGHGRPKDAVPYLEAGLRGPAPWNRLGRQGLKLAQTRIRETRER